MIIVPLKSISGGKERIFRPLAVSSNKAFPDNTANSPFEPSTTIFMFDEMPEPGSLLPSFLSLVLRTLQYLRALGVFFLSRL